MAPYINNFLSKNYGLNKGQKNLLEMLQFWRNVYLLLYETISNEKEIILFSRHSFECYSHRPMLYDM